MTGEWYTARELAGAPGLPTTVRGVQLLAARAGWQWRKRIGRGGGKEYHAGALSEATRLALVGKPVTPVITPRGCDGRRLQLATSMAALADHNARLEGLKAAAGLPDARRARADARLHLLRACAEFIAAASLPKGRGRHLFAQAYNDGQVEITAWVKELVPRTCANSLYNWQRQLSRGGLASLAGRAGRHRKGQSKIAGDDEVRDLIIGLLTTKPHCSAKHVIKALRARFTIDRVPSYRTVQRFVAAWKRDNAESFAAVRNPDAWKGGYMMAAGSASEGVISLNQLWEMDSTPADVMLADGRHSIVGVIDVWSRRAKILVSRTSRASAIALLLRRAMLDWGVPEGVKTDQGQDYTSRHVQRVLQALEIEHVTCAPFCPWEKPHIERFFRTFAHDLVELVGGFIGHDVAERKAIEAQRAFADRLMKRGAPPEVRLAAEEFQAFCDDWCDAVYGPTPHGSLGGMSPMLRAAAAGGDIRRITDERALDVLLSEAPGAGVRVVGKRGLRIDGRDYIAPELEAVVRRRVRVLYDESDIGRVYVFDAEDGAFICIAEAPEITGVDRRTVAAECRRRQRQRVSDERRRLKALAKETRAADVAQEILASARSDAARIVPLPPRAAAHETPALDEAGKAARRGETDAPPPLTQEQEAAADEMLARLRPPAGENVVPLAGPGARPNFTAEDHEGWARWVIDHPDEATRSDWEELEKMLRNPRSPLSLLLGMSDEDRDMAWRLCTRKLRALEPRAEGASG